MRNAVKLTDAAFGVAARGLMLTTLRRWSVLFAICGIVVTSVDGARATPTIAGMPIVMKVPVRFIKWTRKPVPNVDVLVNYVANNANGIREGIIALRSAVPATRTLADSFETLKKTPDLRFIRYESHCGRPFVVVEQTVPLPLPQGGPIIMHSELTIVHDYEEIASAEYSIGYFHHVGQPESDDVMSALRRSCVE